MKYALEDQIKELQDWADNNTILHPDLKIKFSINYNVKKSREEYLVLLTLPDGDQKYLAQYIDNTVRANFEAMDEIKKVFVPGIKRTIADLLMNHNSKSKEI